MRPLQGQLTFENVERKFNFTTCIRQALTLWLSMAKYILWNMEGVAKREVGIHSHKNGGTHTLCSILWADNY